MFEGKIPVGGETGHIDGPASSVQSNDVARMGDARALRPQARSSAVATSTWWLDELFGLARRWAWYSGSFSNASAAVRPRLRFEALEPA